MLVKFEFKFESDGPNYTKFWDFWQKTVFFFFFFFITIFWQRVDAIF